MGALYRIDVDRLYNGETVFNEDLTSVIVYRNGRPIVHTTDDGRLTAISEAVIIVRALRKRGEL